MDFDLVCLEVNLGLKDDKLLLETFPVRTKEVVISEVNFQLIVVPIVDRLRPLASTVADVASLMLLSAMRVQLIVTIEAFPAETTFWMTSKATLIDSTGMVVAELLVSPQLRIGEELVLVREDLLVPCAKVAHDLLVHRPDMMMEVRPAETSNIAVLIRTVEAQKQHCVLVYHLLFVSDA